MFYDPYLKILIKSGFMKEVEEIYNAIDEAERDKELTKEFIDSLTPRYTRKELREIFPEFKNEFISKSEFKGQDDMKDKIEMIKRIPIESIIERHIQMKAGKANCPFHKDDTASFSIWKKKNLYHCFGCQDSGDAIHFIMKYLGYGFKDAVRYLEQFV